MAISGEANFLEDLYRDWTRRMAVEPHLSLAELRALFDEWQAATREPEDVTYKSATIAGIEGVWSLPTDADPTKVLLYLHGGGFMCGSSSSHRKLAGHLARVLKINSLVVDYRRAPEHPFPAQSDDTVAVYRQLLSEGFDPTNIYLAGDSAGGSIAVQAVLTLRNDGTALPGGLICISPWLDLTLSGESLTTSAHTDFLVPTPSGPELIASFLGAHGSTDDPRANVVLADYSGFPPLYINVGSGEALLDDARALDRLARESGVSSTLSVVDGMQHVFVMLAGRASEADDEISRIAEWFSRLV